MIRDSSSWIITGAKTFRLGSRKILHRFGGNLQNIEKSMREVYIPDKGKIFVQTDQSGAEALIVAYLCESKAFRQLFLHGVKPHVYVALHVFKDVWRKKMKDVVGDIPLDISAMCKTPIQALKSNPYWKDLDMLIKDSDNWSMSERYYYLAKQTCHCVDENTEVLTKIGWKKINTVASIGILTEEIAVYGKDRSIKFEIPSVWNSMTICDDMVRFVGEEVDQVLTKGHTVVYESNQKLYTQEAQFVKNQKRLNIPTSGFYIGGETNNPDWYVKLLVAIQADGYWYSENNVRFRFVKQRKIDRLLSILKEGNIEHELRYTDCQEITIKNVKPILDFFGQNMKVKLWNHKLLSWSKNNLELFIDELKYWDGSFEQSHHHKREVYFSKFSNNILWVKTICHLVGKQGMVGYNDDVFFAGINNKKKSIACTKQIIPEWIGTVYCPTVSTGMFLIRRNGKISVTGNSSNYGIEPPAFRMNILEKSGGKIVITKDESEHFLRTYHSLFPEIQDWHRRLRRQIEQTKTVYNMFGMPYTITVHKILETAWKELFAWCPQSTVGMITNIAYAKMQSYIEKNKLDWDLLTNCHDSYLLQCPINEVNECAKMSKEFMEIPFESPVDSAKFNMRSETQAGFNWSPCKEKEKKNMLGLKEIKI